MAAIRSLSAVAALALVQSVHGWNIELPPCTSPFLPFVYTGCFQDPSTPNALSFRSSLDTQTMTIEKCVAECKGNGYRYAGLEYYGECFCGQTVNGAQLNEDQCNFPCTGNSSETCGGNDIISIWQDPTFLPIDKTTTQDYVPLGCYTDDSSIGRTLSYPIDSLDASKMTVESCLSACKSQGFPLAGVEFGSQCWCGVVLANDTQKVDTTQCAMPCNGNSKEICGGSAKINVYVAKDLESLQPCGYKPTTSSSTTTPPPTSTTYPPTTYPPTTTTKPTTTTPPPSTTTSPVCTTTVVTPPKCEYGCGKWCSDNLPDWNDQTGCNNGRSQCKLQVADCFTNAGFPDNMKCFDFAQWCKNIDSYCAAPPTRGKCSKSDCFSRNPPKAGQGYPTTSTITVPCKPTSTKAAPTTSSTTTTTCPIPTATNICKQPTSRQYGYGPGNPVGGIELPVVTCNDIKQDYNSGNQFKLYDNKDSSKCGSYKRTQCSNACADACKSQYDQCSATYAQGCKANTAGTGGKFKWMAHRDTTPANYFDFAGSIAKRNYRGWTDNWSTASNKCYTQYKDCLSENQYVSVTGKCGSYGSGW